MEIPESIKYIPGMIVSIGIVLFLCSPLYICSCTLLFYKVIKPIIDFFKKRKEQKEAKQLSASLPCSECTKLKIERDRLQEKLNKIQTTPTNETAKLNRTISELKACLENYDGETIKAEFNNIILSYVNSQPLVPNVSIAHLARLCSVPKANDRFFRALLQEFEILSLNVTKTENGKHDITMKIKSGENTYTTTLTTCTCGDDYNQTKPKVCKHIYFLALTLGLISSKHYEAFQKSALTSLPEEKIKSLKKK